MVKILFLVFVVLSKNVIYSQEVTLKNKSSFINALTDFKRLNNQRFITPRVEMLSHNILFVDISYVLERDCKNCADKLTLMRQVSIKKSINTGDVGTNFGVIMNPSFIILGIENSLVTDLSDISVSLNPLFGIKVKNLSFTYGYSFVYINNDKSYRMSQNFSNIKFGYRFKIK